MKVVPFKREHLRSMVVQQRQAWMMGLLDDEIYSVLEGSSAFTGFDGEEVIACAGSFEVAPGRYQVWAYISDNIGTRLLWVTRAVERYLEITPYRRIEMDVDCDFKQGHRWARMLGFTMEAERRRSFTPDGRDCALYARVRNA